MEFMVSKNEQNNSTEFICYYCNYLTCNKKDYKKHCLTTKHNNYIKDIKNGNENPKKSQQHICYCGKSYKFYSGLYRHKQKCIFNKNLNSSVNINEQLLKIVSQNEEFKNIIIEQQQENNDLKNYIINIHKNYIISNSLNIEKLINVFNTTINTVVKSKLETNTNINTNINTINETNDLQKKTAKNIIQYNVLENVKNKKTLKFLETNDSKINIENYLKEIPIKLFYIKLLETHGIDNGIQILIINNIKIDNKCLFFIKEDNCFYIKFQEWEKHSYPYNEFNELLCLIIENYKKSLLKWLETNMKNDENLYKQLNELNINNISKLLLNKLKTEI